MKRLVRRKQTAAADEQKTIRSALRRMGFFIGDYADYAGFVESDLDELIERGTIRIIE
jgi:hypothetical protein